jgi:hypothetical protein
MRCRCRTVPSDHTVVRIEGEPRSWRSSHGNEMLSYRLTLRAADGTETSNVELAQRASTPAPEEGGPLFGDIDPRPGNKYGPKFAKAQQGGGGGGGGGGYRPTSEDAARMSRSKAVEIAAGLVSSGHYEKEKLLGNASVIADFIMEGKTL